MTHEAKFPELEKNHIDRLRDITNQVIQRKYSSLDTASDIVYTGKWEDIDRELDFFEIEKGFKFQKLPEKYICYLIKYDDDEFDIDILLWSNNKPTDVQVRIGYYKKNGVSYYEFRDLLIP